MNRLEARKIVKIAYREITEVLEKWEYVGGVFMPDQITIDEHIFQGYELIEHRHQE